MGRKILIKDFHLGLGNPNFESEKKKQKTDHHHQTMDLVFARMPVSYCEYYFRFERDQRPEIEGIITTNQII